MRTALHAYEGENVPTGAAALQIWVLTHFIPRVFLVAEGASEDLPFASGEGGVVRDQLGGNL